MSAPGDQADRASAPEAFIQFIQSLRPAFFHNIFKRFVQALLPDGPARFASTLSQALYAIPEVLVLDGSKLHKMTRTLPATRRIGKRWHPTAFLF